ncbi:hypothetical protein QOT17_008572 [Balamuthia mandrillaris]
MEMKKETSTKKPRNCAACRRPLVTCNKSPCVVKAQKKHTQRLEKEKQKENEKEKGIEDHQQKAALKRQRIAVEDSKWREKHGWSIEEKALPSFPCQTTIPGPKNIPPDAAKTHKDFLEQHILSHSQEKAALRAQAKQRPQTSARSHHKLPAFTHHSFLCFLAVVLVMSFAPARQESNYWKKLRTCFLGNEFIRRTMGYDQYHELKSSLRVNIDDFINHLKGACSGSSHKPRAEKRKLWDS